VRRLHDVGGGSGSVKHETAGQSNTLIWLAHLLLLPINEYFAKEKRRTSNTAMTESVSLCEQMNY
jgi:hypothetical protein